MPGGNEPVHERPRDRPSERRSAVRNSVVWTEIRRLLDAPGAFYEERARIIDIGGGTGGFAVPLAELGHQVTVVDPSPDALAALGRRAMESGVTDLVVGIQGDVGDQDGLAGDADLVLCHGVLEVVDEPITALSTIAAALRPGGVLSLLVAQRHAAVIARAMAGHFHQARALLDSTDSGTGRSGRRFTHDELTGLVSSSGLQITTVHAIRVFADLVPGSLLDVEPGATAALVELERAVAERPEFLALATQLHLLARR